MKVKQNVRQRRQERLKSLMNRQNLPASLTHREEWLSRREPLRSESGLSMNEGAPEADQRMEDPEYVWKLKQKTVGWGYPDPDELRSAASTVRWKEWSQPPTAGQFRFKLVLCVFIYAAIWGLFQIDQPWATNAQSQISFLFTQDFQFDKAALWYKKHFQGFPSFIPAFHSTAKDHTHSAEALFYPPARGTVIRAFSAGGSGIQIQTSAAKLQALTAGRVIFSGRTENTGLTVVIRHANGMQSIYGMLQTAAVHPNDWVEGGDVIATVSNDANRSKNEFYFAIQRNERFVDPTDVISFD